MKKIEILECTLRDGSYPIDYRFTAKDTAMIVLALQDAGFKKIEIGHGLGLNASRTKGKAAESDEVYLRTTREVLTKAEYGMFFIPGIGRKADLDLAARYEMDFVRIGTNITQADRAVEFIKYAKDLGMTTSSNLMKSYALPPDKFTDKARIVDNAGVDVITLVDSSGGMLPHDIKRYLGAMKKKGINAQFGFHGHNNLSMAIANTLTAIDNGATIVDSSLKGIGRSAGNAQTEVLITILKKLGYKIDVDEFKVMDIAESLISPFMATHDGIDSIAITSGYAEFHSSFLNTIYRISKKYSIDPRKLIIEVSKKDKVNVPDHVAEKLAKALHKERAALSMVSRIDVPVAFEISREKWNHKLSNVDRARILCQQLENLSKKTGKQTVFALNISGKSNNINIVYPSVQESSSYLMATCEMTSKKEIIKVCDAINGKVDFLLVDDEKKILGLSTILKELRKSMKGSSVLTYKDNSTWARGIEYFVASYCGDLYELKIGIVGAGNLAQKLALGFCERGARVFVYEEKKSELIESLNKIKMQNAPFDISKATSITHISKDMDILVGTDKNIRINKAMVSLMDRKGIIIDAIFNSIDAKALALAKKLNIRLWRNDMRAAMTGEVTTVLRTNEMIKNMGRTTIGGISVVSGGYIGDKGDVVVDSIINPSQIIGIADGRGSIMYGEEDRYSERIKKVQLELFQRKISGTPIVDEEDEKS